MNPPVRMRSFTAMLRSRPRMRSKASMATWPPSRNGMGSAFNTARLMESSAQRDRKFRHPDLAAWLPILAMAMGPPSSLILARKVRSFT